MVKLLLPLQLDQLLISRLTEQGLDRQMVQRYALYDAIDRWRFENYPADPWGTDDVPDQGEYDVPDQGEFDDE